MEKIYVNGNMVDFLLVKYVVYGLRVILREVYCGMLLDFEFFLVVLVI